MTDKAQAAAGKVVKFGLGQLNNPTPMWANYIFRAISFITGIWALIQHMDMGFAPEMVAKINAWALLGLPLIHFTTKFFGWSYDTSKPDTDNP